MFENAFGGILRWYADHAWVGYPSHPEAAVRRLCGKLAPHLSDSDLDQLVDETVDSNKRWSHDQSAIVLRLGIRDSRRLKLWFLGCDDDANYEIRIGLKKAKDAAKKRKRRAERSSGRPGGRPPLDLSPEQMAARIKAQNAERARRCRASRKTPSPHKIEETGRGTVFSVTTIFSKENAGELIELIPDGGRLAGIGALFLRAEEEAADEPWFCVAIGMMLAGIPTAHDLGDDYRSALADAVYRDEETGGPYSAPVVVRAIREARRTMDDVPSVATFLKLCAKQRRWFQKRRDDINQLLEIRYQAEDHLEAIGLYTPTYDDPEEAVPF
jgi:hypothetical protein